MKYRPTLTSACIFTLIFFGFCTLQAQHTESEAQAPAPDVDTLFADCDNADSPGCAPGVTRQQPVELSPEQLERYAGDFWEPSEAFAAEARVEDGKLWAVHSPERRNELVPLGEDRFQMIGLPSEVIVEFDMSEEGIIEMRRFIDGEPRGVFTPFERRQADETELAEYRADYYSPELDVEYLIRVSGSELLLQIGDEPAQTLTPMFNDTFENPELGAFEFIRDLNGKVTGLKVQSGRVRNLFLYRKI